MLDQLWIRITGDASGFNKAVDSAAAGVNRFARSQLSSIASTIGGAFAVQQVGRYAKSILEMADSTEEAARAAGLGVEAFQALNEVAREEGGSREAMIAGLARLRDMLGQASTGSKTAAASLRAAGVSMASIASGDVAAALEEIARQYVASGGSAVGFSQAADVLGVRTLPQLLGTLQRLGTDGLQQVIDKMREAGRIMSEETVSKLAKANDAWEEFFQRIRVASAGAAVELLKWYDKSSGPSIMSTEGEEGVRKLISASRGKLYTSKELDEMDKRKTAGATGIPAAAPEAASADSVQRYLDAMERQTMSRLDDVGKIARLEERIAQLVALQPTAEEERYRIATDIINAEMELEALQKQREKRAQDEARDRLREDLRRRHDIDRIRRGEGISVSAPQAADALARIGGMVGGQTDRMAQVAERQLKIMTEIRDYNRRMAEKDQEDGVVP
jgi:hypothetical protein